MDPGFRKLLQVGGPALIIIGGILFLSFVNSFGDGFDCGPSGFSSPYGIENRCNDGPSVGTAFFAFGLIGAGSFACRFGYMKPVAEITATETEAAMEVTAGAVGRGVKEALGPALQSRTVVRIKCRECGFLDTEDAQYCSKCGKTM